MASISYDIKAAPRGMSLKQVVHFYKESNMLLYDSNLGNKPEFLSEIEDLNVTIKDVTFGVPEESQYGDIRDEMEGHANEEN